MLYRLLFQYNNPASERCRVCVVVIPVKTGIQAFDDCKPIGSRILVRDVNVYEGRISGVTAAGAASFVKLHSLLEHLMPPLVANTSGCWHSGHNSPFGLSQIAKSQVGYLLQP